MKFLKILWIKLKMHWVAYRARVWDDRYFLYRNHFDCGSHLMEHMCPQTRTFRLEWEARVRQYHALAEELQELRNALHPR